MHTHMHANILVASKAVLYLRFSVLLLEAPMSMLFARAWEGERGKRQREEQVGRMGRKGREERERGRKGGREEGRKGGREGESEYSRRISNLLTHLAACHCSSSQRECQM